MTKRLKTMSELFHQIYGGSPLNGYVPKPWDYTEDLDWILSAKKKALGIPDDYLDPQRRNKDCTDPIFEVVKYCLLPVVDENFDKFQDYIRAAKKLIWLLKDMHDEGWFDIHLLEEANETFLTICSEQRGPNMQTTSTRPTAWLYKKKEK